MFIAHAPSGYLLGALAQRLKYSSLAPRTLMFACLAGATAPDLDLLYFYLIDGRQTHHHQYFSHWPLLWIGLAALNAAWLSVRRRSVWAQAGLVFAVGGLLHMLLDSFVGDIWWLAPFHDQAFALFSVPARYDPWWLSFVLHWSFAVELVICLAAVVVFARRHHSRMDTPPCSPCA